MLRKIMMIGLVVVGLVMAGLGVASGTVWRPSDTAVMTAAPQAGSTLVTTAPGVLGLVDEDVTVTATSSPEATVVLAVGSTTDVAGWVGQDPVAVVSGATDWDTLTVSPPTGEAPETAPDPSSSDMWDVSVSGTGSATLSWRAVSSDQVLLVAAVGEGAEAPTLTLTWPREVTTPWMWPGVLVGAVFVVAGCLYGIFFVFGRRAKAGKDAAAGRKATRKSLTGADGTALDRAEDDEPAAGLTRRELRERAARIEAARVAQEGGPDEAEAPKKPKRQWPWTGAIALVKPADTPASDPVPVVDPKRPAWLPEGSASTSASTWRQNWGLRPESASPPPATGAVPTGFPARRALTQPEADTSASDTSVPGVGAPQPTAPAPVQAYLRRSGVGAAARPGPGATPTGPTGSPEPAGSTAPAAQPASPRPTSDGADQPYRRFLPPTVGQAPPASGSPSAALSGSSQEPAGESTTAAPLTRRALRAAATGATPTAPSTSTSPFAQVAAPAASPYARAPHHASDEAPDVADSVDGTSDDTTKDGE